MNSNLQPASGLQPVAEPVASWPTGWEESAFTGNKIPGVVDAVSHYEPEVLNRPELRRLSRRYYIANSNARGLIDTKTTAVINNGLCLEAKPLTGIIGEVPSDWAQKTEQAFDLWASHLGADYCFELNFYQMQAIAFREHLNAGWVGAIPRYIEAPRRGRIGRLNLQIVRQEQLETPMEELPRKRKKGEDIVDGRHLDKTGTVVGYYFRRNLNGVLPSTEQQTVYIPRWATKTGRPNVISVVRPQGPGDMQGMPDLTPVLHDLGKLEDYRVAEILAASVNASISIVTESTGDAPSPPMLGGVGRRPASTATGGGEPEMPTYKRVSPGMHLWAAQPGTTTKSFDTKRPNVNFEAFVNAVVGQASAACGVPPEILRKRFGNNYSASRAALLEFWRYVTQERAWWGWNFCQPVYELWLADEYATGNLGMDGWENSNQASAVRSQKAWAYAEWQGTAKGSVDPLREAKAAVIHEQQAWNTPDSIARELCGKSYDSNLERRRNEGPRREPIQESSDESDGLFDE